VSIVFGAIGDVKGGALSFLHEKNKEQEPMTKPINSKYFI
jgi:hypothetical protein